MSELVVTKIGVLTGHAAGVYILAPGIQENCFLSGGSDGYVVQWSLDTLKQEKFVARFPSIVYSIFPLPSRNIILVGTVAGALHVLDLKTSQEIKVLQFHKLGIFDIAVSEKHGFIYTSGSDGLLSVYSLEKLTHIESIPISTQKLRKMELNDEKDELIIADGVGDTHVFSLPNLHSKNTFVSHKLSCNAVCSDLKNNLLFTGGRDAHINVWDANNKYQLLKSIPAHNYAVYDIKLLKGLGLLASASRDKSIKIWEIKTQEFLCKINKEEYDGHSASVNSLLWNQEKNLLVTTGDDRTIIVWNVRM